jgi:HEAT repeat protein
MQPLVYSVRTKFFLAFLVVPALFLFSQEEEAVRSALDEWRDTLLYGINSEIADLLPTLTENRTEELAPEVVTLLESSSDSDVLAEGLRFLLELEIGDGRDVAEAIVATADERPDPLVVTALTYLNEVIGEITADTEEALFRLAREGAVGPASAAVTLLATAGVSSDELIELYREGDLSDDIRGRILVELGKRGDPEVLPFIREVIGDDEEATTTLQRYAIDTLGKLGVEEALPTILLQMGSDDALTRAYAVNALRGFDTPEANEALLTALRDEFWRVRVAALETIAERKMNEALPAVIYKVRRDPERRVRLEAVDTLAELDAPDGWALLEEVVTETGAGVDVRSAALDHLIRQRPRQSREVVMTVIETEWDRNNSRLLDVIGRVVSQVTDQRVEPIVARLLDHPNYILQIYGLRAIGASNLLSLREIAADRAAGEGNHSAVRSAALRSLEQLGIAPPPEETTPAEETPSDETGAPGTDNAPMESSSSGAGVD